MEEKAALKDKPEVIKKELFMGAILSHVVAVALGACAVYILFKVGVLK